MPTCALTALQQLPISPFKLPVENLLGMLGQSSAPALVADPHRQFDLAVNVALIAPLSEGYLLEAPLYFPSAAKLASAASSLGSKARSRTYLVTHLCTVGFSHV